jgi:hypothetical protein
MNTSISTQEKSYWKRPKAYRVLDLVKRGKSLEEIAGEVGWREETIQNFISTPSFLEKMNNHLRAVYLHYQITKILALPALFSHLFEIAMERKVAKNFPPAKAAALFIQMLKIDQEPRSMNFQQLNIIADIPKPVPKSQKELEAEFGFQGLEEDEPISQQPGEENSLDEEAEKEEPEKCAGGEPYILAR